ncbi:MAG TPA: tetratricopeptide repeat protein [Gemmatimonadota bacterium]|nr:tetratricopeptide repeat protein [Gemmatimonadota bacterium]
MKSDEQLPGFADGAVPGAPAADQGLEAARELLASGLSEEAATEARRAGGLARERGDDVGLARAENLLGEIAWESGRWEEASRLFGAAREHAEAAGDGALLLWIESNDAAVHTDLGQGELAREALSAALPRLALVDGHPHAVWVLCNLGRVLGAVDQMTAADELLERAMAIAKRKADTHAGIRLAIQRARLALARRDVVRADTLVGTVSALAGRIENAVLRAEAACLEGEVQRIAGRPDAAERALRQALELAGAAGADGVSARAWRELGELHAGEGKTGAALSALAAAREHFVALGARARAAEAGRRADELALLAGDSPPPGPVAAPEDHS